MAYGKILYGRCTALFLLVCTLFCLRAVAFSDVPSDAPCYEAVTALAKDGIINGYPDGTFAPNACITRTEAAVLVTKAADIRSENAENGYPSPYRDVPADYWGLPYIIAATREGIISGMGGEQYAPEEPVTGFQIVKMAVCTAGLADMVKPDAGHWAYGYLDAAWENGIIDDGAFYAMRYGTKGEEKATRAEVAIILYQTKRYLDEVQEDRLTVGDTALTIGSHVSALGEPEEVLDSVYGFDWYVYGTQTYDGFFAVGVKKKKVAAYLCAGNGFSFRGMSFGSALVPFSSRHRVKVLTDPNDGDIVHAVFVCRNSETWQIGDETALAGESRLLFHLTNAFRVSHEKKPLFWSDIAAKAARLHSTDMAVNNYFSHRSNDGRDTVARMENAGVHRWSAVAENIIAGYSDGFLAYGGWVNSAGHRNNMLGNFTHLGVGGSYHPSSVYRVYFTQDFFSGE